MRTIRIAGLTPRIRFIIISGLTLVPLAAVLMVVVLFAFMPVFDALETAAQTTVKRMIPVHRLQHALQRSMIPPRDFLRTGEAREQVAFARHAAAVKVAFKQAEAAYPDDGEAQASLRQARQHWQRARKQAKALFRSREVDSDRLEREFDVPIAQAGDELDELHERLHDHILGHFARAETRKTQGIFLAVGAFVLSLGAGLVGGIALTRDRDSLEEHSIRDPLTGLFNRRGFESRLQEAARYTLTYERPAFALLAIDADRFKEINDRHGHQTGDAVLKRLAQVVQDHLRGGDFFARMGGDEFVILLSDMECGEVDKLAERIRQAVETTPLAWSAQGVAVYGTVTIGCACFPEHAADEEAVMAAADQALYRAKEQGRNCVAVYAGSE